MRSDQGRLGDWILTSGGGESSYHYHHHHRILLAADAGAGRRSAGCRQVDRSMRRASLGLRNQKERERERITTNRGGVTRAPRTAARYGIVASTAWIKIHTCKAAALASRLFFFSFLLLLVLSCKH